MSRPSASRGAKAPAKAPSGGRKRGGDPFVWGGPVWALLEDAVACVQDRPSVLQARAAARVALALTQLLLCNPCRLFYIQRFETEPHPTVCRDRLVRAWVRDMRHWVRSLHAAVAYKIAATRPCAAAAPPMGPRRTQLDRREAFYGGSMVGNGAILQVLDAMTRYHRFRSEPLYRAAFAMLLRALPALYSRSTRVERRRLAAALEFAAAAVSQRAVRTEGRALAALPSVAGAKLWRSSPGVVRREWSARYRHLFA